MHRIRILTFIKKGYDTWSAIKMMLEHEGYEFSNQTIWDDLKRFEKYGLIEVYEIEKGVKKYRLTVDGRRALELAKYVYKSKRRLTREELVEKFGEELVEKAFLTLLIGETDFTVKLIVPDFPVDGWKVDLGEVVILEFEQVRPSIDYKKMAEEAARIVIEEDKLLSLMEELLYRQNPPRLSYYREPNLTYGYKRDY